MEDPYMILFLMIGIFFTWWLPTVNFLRYRNHESWAFYEYTFLPTVLVFAALIGSSQLLSTFSLVISSSRKDIYKDKRVQAVVKCFASTVLPTGLYHCSRLFRRGRKRTRCIIAGGFILLFLLFAYLVLDYIEQTTGYLFFLPEDVRDVMDGWETCLFQNGSALGLMKNRGETVYCPWDCEDYYCY